MSNEIVSLSQENNDQHNFYPYLSLDDYYENLYRYVKDNDHCVLCGGQHGSNTNCQRGD